MSRKVRVFDCLTCNQVSFLPPKPSKSYGADECYLGCENCFSVVRRDKVSNSRLMSYPDYAVNNKSNKHKVSA